MNLLPPSAAEWNYVLFSQSFLPQELSRATSGEPDNYLLREGNLFLGSTRSGMKLLGGGDTCCRLCTPIGTESRSMQTVTLLCNNDRFRRAKPKGASVKPNQDNLLR